MTTSDAAAIVWFRRDLRLDDNPAFSAAVATHREIIALFVHDERLVAGAGPFRQRQYFADLHALDQRLRSQGGRLRVISGPAETAVAAEAERVGANAVYVNLDASNFARRRDLAVEAALAARGVSWHGAWGGFVHEPGRVRTGRGSLSQVFTPFWRTWQTTPRTPWPGLAEDATSAAGRLRDEPGEPLPHVDGEPTFPAGEAGAWDRLRLLDATIDRYLDERDIPAIDGTTQLSAALRAGTIAARTVIDIVGTHTPGREAIARQLAWRDWWAHLLWEHPTLPTHAVNVRYDHIVWRDDPAGFAAWCEGRTGYPLVDAGMRQLASTGWMHNRVRMVTASFLAKHLLIDWRRGEQWFRRVLIDSDVAQNAGNWQWVAGLGPDAAPYFRIFNPVAQSKKFDPYGTYIKRWVPELAGLSARDVHEPWRAGSLFTNGYPAPIVDHAEARQRCLAAYKAIG